jgi:hypothetical protein
LSSSIGSFEWHDVHAEFEGAGEGAVSVRHNAGIIGAGILKHFRVVLDRTNAVMCLMLGGAGASGFERNAAGERHLLWTGRRDARRSVAPLTERSGATIVFAPREIPKAGAAGGNRRVDE